MFLTKVSHNSANFTALLFVEVFAVESMHEHGHHAHHIDHAMAVSHTLATHVRHATFFMTPSPEHHFLLIIAIHHVKTHAVVGNDTGVENKGQHDGAHCECEGIFVVAHDKSFCRAGGYVMRNSIESVTLVSTQTRILKKLYKV